MQVFWKTFNNANMFFFKEIWQDCVLNKRKFVILLQKYINFFEKLSRKTYCKNFLFFRNKLFLGSNMFIKPFHTTKQQKIKL